MKTNQYLFLTLLFLLVCTISNAQQTLDLGKNNYDEKKGILYSKEVTVDFKLHTNGAAMALNFGSIETYYRTRYWHFELGELKHVRETRQSRSLQGGGTFGGSFRSYIYGKQNNFFVLRGGLGEKRYISDKAKRKGVAVGFTYEAGPSLGLLKPYYLVLRSISENAQLPNYRSERYSSDNADRFLNNRGNVIYGADSFTRGLGEITIMPGGHAQGALHFDWGTYDEFVKALEVGFMVDFYLKDVPIMVESELIPNQKNQPFFLNLYVTLQFGKRS